MRDCLRPVHLHNSWHLTPLIITVPILQRRRGRDKRINHKDVKLQRKDLSPKPGSPGQALNPNCSTSYLHSTKATRKAKGPCYPPRGPDFGHSKLLRVASVREVCEGFGSAGEVGPPFPGGPSRQGQQEDEGLAGPGSCSLRKTSTAHTVAFLQGGKAALRPQRGPWNSPTFSWRASPAPYKHPQPCPMVVVLAKLCQATGEERRGGDRAEALSGFPIAPSELTAYSTDLKCAPHPSPVPSSLSNSPTQNLLLSLRAFAHAELLAGEHPVPRTSIVLFSRRSQPTHTPRLHSDEPFSGSQFRCPDDSCHGPHSALDLFSASWCFCSRSDCHYGTQLVGRPRTEAQWHQNHRCTCCSLYKGPPLKADSKMSFLSPGSKDSWPCVVHFLVNRADQCNQWDLQM